MSRVYPHVNCISLTYIRRSLDLITLGANQQTLTVYLWNHGTHPEPLASDKYLFQPGNYTFIKSTPFQHPQKVYNVIPGDFTQDGKLDILVMSQDHVSSQLGIQLYAGLPEGGFGTPT